MSLDEKVNICRTRGWAWEIEAYDMLVDERGDGRPKFTQFLFEATVRTADGLTVTAKHANPDTALGLAMLGMGGMVKPPFPGGGS